MSRRSYFVVVLTVTIIVIGLVVVIARALTPYLPTIGLALTIIIISTAAIASFLGLRLLGAIAQGKVAEAGIKRAQLWKEQHLIPYDAQGNPPALVQFANDGYSIVRQIAPQRVQGLLPPPQIVTGFHHLPLGHPGHTPSRLSYTHYNEPENVVESWENEAVYIPKPLPAFSQCLASGLIGPRQRKLLVGFREGEPWIGPWALLYSFMILGASGGGKSALATFYATQSVCNGARILLIDPHARANEQSLAARLEPLSFAYLSPVAMNPEGVTRVLDIAEAELERRNQGRGGKYPLLLLVDEFSKIMREGSVKGSPWAAVARRLANCIESIGTEGRKVGVFVVPIAQVTNADRLGGTTVREAMTATIVCKMHKKQALNVMPLEIAENSESLKPGEYIVWPTEGDPEQIAIPEPLQEDVIEIGDLMLEKFIAAYPDVARAFGGSRYPGNLQGTARYTPTPPASADTRESMREQVNYQFGQRASQSPFATTGSYQSRQPIPLFADDGTVRDEPEEEGGDVVYSSHPLHRAGAQRLLEDEHFADLFAKLPPYLHDKAVEVYARLGRIYKVAILKEVWGVNPGGGEPYKTACAQYEQIMTAIRAWESEMGVNDGASSTSSGA